VTILIFKKKNIKKIKIK